MVSVHEAIQIAEVFLEVAGTAVILFGIIHATVLSTWRWYVHKADEALFRNYRTRLGRSILLGLEFLVAADIINSVTVKPTFESVGVLLVIVAIRTFLSFTLEVEMNGRWPWQGRSTPDES
jgi:uncharacterized membrane protein